MVGSLTAPCLAGSPPFGGCCGLRHLSGYPHGAFGAVHQVHLADLEWFTVDHEQNVPDQIGFGLVPVERVAHAFQVADGIDTWVEYSGTRKLDHRFWCNVLLGRHQRTHEDERGDVRGFQHDVPLSSDTTTRQRDLEVQFVVFYPAKRNALMEQNPSAGYVAMAPCAATATHLFLPTFGYS